MSKIFALVTLLICILNGCQTIREKASGPEFENAKLTAIVKAQLAREDQATLQAVTVDVDDRAGLGDLIGHPVDDDLLGRCVLVCGDGCHHALP